MSKLTSFSFIIATFIPAFILMIIPLPDYIMIYRPAWVPLCILFWLMQSEGHCIGLIFCWIVGLFMDIVFIALLGQHGLALLLMSMLAIQIRKRLNRSKMLEQMVLVFLLIMLFKLSELWLDLIIGGVFNFQWIVVSFSSALCWPFLSKGLKAWDNLYRS
ncbi:MAG: rod shape-determining protein MreD [Endozoicomonadaceae bacterium]|nr:rod shape-determining protein MreD [Endozoicomonadaceae bacterium]